MKHARKIDLTCSFLFLVAEWIFQIGLMLAVLPFVGIWSGLLRAYGGMRAFDVRRVWAGVGFWNRRSGDPEVEEEEEEDIIEATLSRRITDDGIRIEITTAATPARPPPRSSTAHRPSLIPTPSSITAYTLSSPQTLRRAVTQAREIYADIEGKRREAGKKRGEGELVRGMMKRRMAEMEDTRIGGGAVGRGVQSGKVGGDGAVGPKPTMNAVAGPSTGKPTRAPRGRKAQLANPSVTHSSINQPSGHDAGPSKPPGRGRSRGTGARMAETGRRVVRPLVGAVPATVGEGTSSVLMPQVGETVPSLVRNVGPVQSQPAVHPPTNRPAGASRSVYPSMTDLLAHPHASRIVQPEPSASSGSTFGLGFGDVGGTEETSIASTEETRSARSLFVPGGFPLSFSPASVRTHQDARQSPPSLLKDSRLSATGSAESKQQLGPEASTSTLAVPGSTQPARSGRPQLRKNNSLGLMGTLDSMRSPSLEPTSAFAHVPPMIGRRTPSADSHVGHPSRLRQINDRDSVTATYQTPEQSLLAEPSTVRAQRTSSQGIYVPLMPLPLVTPASSPQIRQSNFMHTIPDVGGPSGVGEAVKVNEPDQQSRIANKVSSVKAASPEKEAESSDLSELEDEPTTAAITTGTGSRLKAGWQKPVEARGVPVRVTRAVRPGVPTGPVEVAERNQTTRGTSVGRSNAQARRGRVDLAASRVAAQPEKGISAKPNVAKSEDIGRMPSTSTSRDAPASPLETAADKPNDRKRKEPPQTMPTRVQRRTLNVSTVRVTTQRAVRPVIPAAVSAIREFALPEGIIADVTPVRRTRASGAAASQTLVSPTKKRKTNTGQSATVSTAPSAEGSDTAEGDRAPRRSRRARSGVAED